MDRQRYLDWAEHQLRFFAGADHAVIALGHRRSVQIESELELFLEAHPDGTIVVGIETEDEDRRSKWGETFRRTRRGSPPWPPGPPPESVGPIELTTDDRDQRARLHFRWMFLGQNFLLEVPNASAGMSWLLLAELEATPHPREITLPEVPEEPLEIEWDSN